MRVKFTENEFGANIELEPENMAEANKLMRMTRNVKQEKPGIYFSFASDIPNCSIHFRKVKKNNQYNSIRPGK